MGSPIVPPFPHPSDNRPLIANQIITGILFTVAILAATIRTLMRVRQKHRLFLSDAFLILACMALTATTIIMDKGLAVIEYADELLVGHELPKFEVTGNVEAGVQWYARTDYLHELMTWLVIFSVKFSFLAFFHQLTTRLPKFLLYWKLMLIVTYNGGVRVLFHFSTHRLHAYRSSG